MHVNNVVCTVQATRNFVRAGSHDVIACTIAKQLDLVRELTIMQAECTKIDRVCRTKIQAWRSCEKKKPKRTIWEQAQPSRAGQWSHLVSAKSRCSCEGKMGPE